MTELLISRRVEAFRRIREDEAARLVSSLSSSSLSPGQLSIDMGGPDMDERLELFIADSSCAPSWATGYLLIGNGGGHAYGLMLEISWFVGKSYILRIRS
jgi:hypothetical protein